MAENKIQIDILSRKLSNLKCIQTKLYQRLQVDSQQQLNC